MSIRLSLVGVVVRAPDSGGSVLETIALPEIEGNIAREPAAIPRTLEPRGARSKRSRRPHASPASAEAAAAPDQPGPPAAGPAPS